MDARVQPAGDPGRPGAHVCAGAWAGERLASSRSFRSPTPARSFEPCPGYRQLPSHLSKPSLVLDCISFSEGTDHQTWAPCFSKSHLPGAW